ncbi:hypothetical protein [Streptomyces eurythermus]|uniref:hypothetical protein n=1 Tax=Streptomyces eurythermus TaxID=42237 RepID=UPI0036D3C67F
MTYRRYVALADSRTEGLADADDTWTRPLAGSAAPASAGWRAAAGALRWAAAFLGPWLGRRLRGSSPGDGHTANARA